MTAAGIESAEDLVLQTLRRETNQLLAECTEKQQAFFARIFPNGLDKVGEQKLRSAYELCRRTVEKNRETIGDNQ